jgi:hypothetical protein
MSTVYIALAIVVAFILAVVGPWALLRKLEREGEAEEKGEGSGPKRK